MVQQQTRACTKQAPPALPPHTQPTHNLLPSRVDRWDAWLAGDLEGAQAVVRCACAASEPAFAEELILKAGFSCGSDLQGGGDGELEGVRFLIATRRKQKIAKYWLFYSLTAVRRPFVSTFSSFLFSLPTPPPPPLGVFYSS